MKNFRKVLALVLVVATLFSFTAMTSAAYEDASDISYAEAVNVLSAVGILNGYEVAEDEYEFKPTQTISREEMAKMIAVLANAGDDVSTLYASASSFADVPAARWSASYVAYCAKTGIVAGRSASTFDPTGKVTGLETAKMLLVVLGFDAEEQGYVGADWKVNVLRDAKVMGLLNNFAADYDVDAAITREEAAQMMLNALEAPCVIGIVSDGLVTMTNALVVNWKGLSGDLSDMLEGLLSVTAYGKLKDAMDAGQWCLYGNVLISNDTLASRLYGLTKAAAKENADCYKRPAYVWTWTDAKGNEIVAGSKVTAPAFSKYNTTVDAVEKFLDTYDEDDYNVTYYVDGETGTLTAGNGALVEVYVVEQGKVDELRVVEINTYIGKIDDVDTYHGTVEIDGHTAKNTFGLKTADEGKVALYWQCAGKHTATGYDLHDIELATPVTVTVTKAVKNNTTGASYFVASGDKYEYAKTFDQTINVDNKVFGEVVDGKAYGVGSEWDVYTDKQGYVMAYVPAGSTEYKYAVVDYGSATMYTGAYNKVLGDYDRTYTVKMVNFEDDPAVGEAVGAALSMYDRVDNSSKKSDTLVKYYVDASGNVAVDEEVDKNRNWAAEVVLKDALMNVEGAYLTEDTQILLRVLNPMTGKHEYKYFDGIDELDAVYEVENLGYYYSGKYMTYAYGEAEYVQTANKAYFLGKGESVVYLTDGNKVVGYNTYKAIVNGEEAVIATEDVVSVFGEVYELNLVRIGLTTDDDEPVYFGAKAVEDAVEPTEVDTIDTGKGLMFIADKAWRLDTDAKFVVVFTDGWGDEEFDVMSAAELVEYTSDWAHVYVWADDADNDGDVDMVYVNAECGEGCEH